MLREIVVRGARTNNLQAIDVSIPHGRLTVVTGVSGSGKSSLAFDTLYAEGQRLYVESMSAYARQFLERMPRPPVDSIRGVLPSIALEQRNQVTNPRSTVGTATEINDFLRLLFANVGRTVCPECGVEAEKHSPQTAVRFIEGLAEGTRFLVLAPIAVESERRFEFLREHLASAGFHRVLLDGEVVDLAGSEIAGGKPQVGNCLEVVVDRLAKSAERMGRAADSVEMAFRIGSRGAVVLTLGPDGRPGERHHFFAGLVCRSCGREFREPQPEMFSFNSGIGACPTCEGFGKEGTLDLGKIIPDPSKTLAGYAVALWATPVLKMMTEWMLECAAEDGIPTDVPYRDLTAEQKRWVIEGKPGGGDEDFCGIQGFFRWLEGRKYKIQNRILIARYRRYTPCKTCGGARLKPDAQWVKVGGRSFPELLALPVPELHRFLDALALTPADAEAARGLLHEVRGRLQYLEDVGLSYLTLSRETRTLSGGEAQRIGLASALGSALTNTLYVLDEPTVGLHAADTQRLLAILRALTGKGNTVVCVEHEPEVILGADHVLDLGPGAGEHGGRVVFEGAPQELLRHGRGNTADCLRQRRAAEWPCRARKPRSFITLRGAEQHNLKKLDVRIPLGVLACVTGVSGAGKSTLVNGTLYAHWRAARGETGVEPGKCRSLRGLEQVKDMVLVDQRPLGRSARSNAVTYTKAYDDIRRAFAATRRARTLGITAAQFSFNVPGGRCESCQGMGTQTVDMHFLADVTVTCDACGGKRFQKRVLEVTDRGRTILDVLDMTIAEALGFYADTPRLVAKLRPLAEVGLGYLRLGQSTATLSGGELQRLKLAAYISGAFSSHGSRITNHTLLILNEPTVGLHMSDVQVLMSVLQRLVDGGHSVLIVEHNLDVIAQADWVIDLGPGGGEAGGELVAEGPPAAIAACERSVTGRFLRTRLREQERQ
ncbi:MAG TPA: excinuclease ABC subunit UvrA [Planctomycetota bacterium]|nr:excinuclease ABC subunit UvrA [Planctomycetota bacterium]HRR82599.1 excinuclease ABC subunit UvrA [Planctomycetota bacterium]HRT94605.1 excinuclease ABC subunit UvrA [Planctomycetota bacterium]